MSGFPARFAGVVDAVHHRPQCGRGMLLEPHLQGFHAVVKLSHLVAPGAQRGVDSRRGVIPVLLGKEKRPSHSVGLRQLLHIVSNRYAAGYRVRGFLYQRPAMRSSEKCRGAIRERAANQTEGHKKYWSKRSMAEVIPCDWPHITLD